MLWCECSLGTEQFKSYQSDSMWSQVWKLLVQMKGFGEQVVKVEHLWKSNPLVGAPKEEGKLCIIKPSAPLHR